MSIIDQVQKIRSFITHHRRPAALLTSVADWNTLCSSLDVIRDTELAFDAYSDCSAVSDVGRRYLLVYGVLQGLLIQQDAVKKVCETFQSPPSFPSSMKKIGKYVVRPLAIPCHEIKIKSTTRTSFNALVLAITDLH